MEQTDIRSIRPSLWETGPSFKEVRKCEHSVLRSFLEMTILDAGPGPVNSPYSSYKWNTGASTQMITVSLAGNYSVTISDNGNCGATSAPFTLTVYPWR